MPTQTNEAPTWEATEAIEPTWEETEEIPQSAQPPVSAPRFLPPDAQFKLTPYQKAKMEGRDTGMWGEGPIAMMRGEGGEGIAATAQAFIPASVAAGRLIGRTWEATGIPQVGRDLLSDWLVRTGIDPSSTPSPEMGRVLNLPRLTPEMTRDLPQPLQIGAGVANVVPTFIEGMAQDPALFAATFGTGTLPQVARTLLGTQQFLELPQEIRDAAQVWADPKSSTAEKTQAILQPGVGALFAREMIKHGWRPRGPEQITGEDLRGRPQGAPLPPQPPPVPTEPVPPRTAFPPGPPPSTPVPPREAYPPGPAPTSPVPPREAFPPGPAPSYPPAQQWAFRPDLPPGPAPREAVPARPEPPPSAAIPAPETPIATPGTPTVAATFSPETIKNFLTPHEEQATTTLLENLKSGDATLPSTEAGWKLGMSIRTPEQLRALKEAWDAAKTRSDKIRTLPLEERFKAFGQVNQSMFLREAYEAATGTGSAFTTLSKIPGYKPPFPEGAPSAPAAAPEPEPAVAAPTPTAPPATEPTPPATFEQTVVPGTGKTIGEWEGVRDASGLPKGDARAALAKWLAVPNQPSRILQALANKKKTREIHAPPMPIEEAVPAAEPTPPVETKPAEPETKPPVSETKPPVGETPPAPVTTPAAPENEFQSPKPWFPPATREAILSAVRKTFGDWKEISINDPAFSRELEALARKLGFKKTDRRFVDERDFLHRIFTDAGLKERSNQENSQGMWLPTNTTDTALLRSILDMVRPPTETSPAISEPGQQRAGTEPTKTTPPSAPIPPTPTPAAKAQAEVSKVAAPKFKMTFEQFLNAPREGELMDELRKVPKSEETPQRKATRERYDKASEELQKANLGWAASEHPQAELAVKNLTKKQQKIVKEYNDALDADVKESSKSSQARQRVLYDDLVKRGVIEQPTQLGETGSVGPGAAASAEFTARENRRRLLADVVERIFGSRAGEAVDALSRKVAGEVVPKTMARSGESGNAMVRFAASSTAAPYIAHSHIIEVLGDHLNDADFRDRLGAVLVEDRLRAIRWGLEKAGKSADAGNVNTLIGKGKPFATEADFQAALKDPEIAAAIERHKQTIQPEAERFHTEAEGQLAGPGINTGAFVNLLPLFEDTPAMVFRGVAKGDYTRPFKRKSVFSRQAKGTAEKYETDYSTLAERMIRGNYEEFTKRQLYDQLVKDNLAVVLPPAAPRPTFEGKPGVKFQIKRQVIATGAGVIPQYENLWVDPAIAPELRAAENLDGPIRNVALARVANVLNRIQLAGPTDAVWHTANMLSLIAGSPGGKTLLTDIARQVPLVNVVDAVVRVASEAKNILANDPETMRRVADLAEIGQIRADRPQTGPVSRFINLIDKAGRVVRDKMYENLSQRKNILGKPLIEPSEAGRREWVGQLGQYNPRLMGQIESFFKEAGLSPFIVAGRNFNRAALRRVTLSPGVRGADLASAIQMRAVQGLGLITALAAVPAAINYFTTGSPFGRKGVPFGAIDTGKDSKDGHYIIIDPAQWIGLRRGMRMTGANALIEGLRRGELPSQIARRAGTDIASALIHPWAGPVVQAGSILRTGYSTSGFKESKDPHDYWQNFLGALRNINPILHGWFQRQGGLGIPSAASSLAGAIGVKGAAPFTAGQEVYNLAQRWKSQSGNAKYEAEVERRLKEDFGPSDYRDLRGALGRNDLTGARRAYYELRQQGKTPKTIRQTLQHPHPFTGSAAAESRFRASLNQDERELYNKAIEERRQLYHKFQQMLQTPNQ